MLAVTINAGLQQPSSSNADTTSVNEGNAICHSHQEGNQNENAAQYLECAHERERTMNVQKTNVGYQHPFSYTNYSPAYGGVEGTTHYVKGRTNKVSLVLSHTMVKWKCQITTTIFNKLTYKEIPTDMAKIHMTHHEVTPGDKETW